MSENLGPAVLQQNRLCMQNRQCVSENLVPAVPQHTEKTGFACKMGDLQGKTQPLSALKGSVLASASGAVLLT